MDLRPSEQTGKFVEIQEIQETVNKVTHHMYFYDPKTVNVNALRRDARENNRVAIIHHHDHRLGCEGFKHELFMADGVEAAPGDYFPGAPADVAPTPGSELEEGQGNAHS